MAASTPEAVAIARRSVFGRAGRASVGAGSFAGSAASSARAEAVAAAVEDKHGLMIGVQFALIMLVVRVVELQVM